MNIIDNRNLEIRLTLEIFVVEIIFGVQPKRLALFTSVSLQISKAAPKCNN